MKNMLLLILAVILTSGCGRPSEPEYLTWIAEGSSIVEVKKKLLECGQPSTSRLPGSEYDRNMQMTISLCMMRAGFRDKNDYPFCKYEYDKALPACAPGAIIPTPSISRRLNSYYCRLKLDYQYCKQNAFNPEACDKNDYNNPVPECLP